MFLLCGEALFDFFCDESRVAPDAAAIDFHAVAGGSPMNVAIGLARLQRRSAFFTGLARDALGERLRAVLRREGVDITPAAEIEQGVTTLAMVTLDARGAPHYVFYNHSGADRLLEPRHLPAPDEALTAVHVGSYTLVVSPTGETLEQLVARESERCLITLDPNVRLMVEPDTARWRERIDTFAGYAHLIKVSDEDLALLYPDDDPERVVRDWLSERCPLVIMTRGGEGVRLFLHADGHEDFAPVAVEVVDTVGAGDSFMAALLCWLDEQGLATTDGPARLDAEQRDAMVRFAMSAAAAACTRRGPDLPSRNELTPLSE